MSHSILCSQNLGSAVPENECTSQLWFLLTQNTWPTIESAPICSLQDDMHAGWLQLTVWQTGFLGTVAVSLPLVLPETQKAWC